MPLDSEYYKRHEAFQEYIESKGYTFLGSGSFRGTWVRPNNKSVIKIPRCYDGELDNLMESKAWHKYRNRPTSLGLMIPPCRILPNKCLMMAWVDTYNWSSPPWKRQIGGKPTLDGDQVGIYKGRVVAYDFGLDLTERLGWEQELGITDSFFQREWKDYRPHLLPSKETTHNWNPLTNEWEVAVKPRTWNFVENKWE